MQPTQMNNVRDVGGSMSDIAAGFQFEFFCENCSQVWRSSFKPYRKGQLTGLLNRASYLSDDLGSWMGQFSKVFSNLYRLGRGAGAVSDAGSKGARNEALAEATAQAQAFYHCCESCSRWVGDECFNEREALCITCVAQRQQGASVGSASASGAMSCPNCQTASQGGRFCHECGFDMASTHKSCPSCGTALDRAARFCGDCGHGF